MREQDGLVHATYKDKFKYVANFLREDIRKDHNLSRIENISMIVTQSCHAMF